MIEEKWAVIEGFESYEVSDLGNIRSIEREVKYKNGRVHKYKSKNLKLFVASNGYKRASLWKNRKMKIAVVHQVVMEAFVGKRPDGMVVCHCDGNKLNNALSNLRYDTYKNNSKDAVDAGTIKHGESVPNTKLSKTAVMEIYNSDMNQYATAEKFKISRSTIADIRAGRTWRHLTGKTQTPISGSAAIQARKVHR